MEFIKIEPKKKQPAETEPSEPAIQWQPFPINRLPSTMPPDENPKSNRRRFSGKSRPPRNPSVKTGTVTIEIPTIEQSNEQSLRLISVCRATSRYLLGHRTNCGMRLSRRLCNRPEALILPEPLLVRSPSRLRRATTTLT